MCARSDLEDLVDVIERDGHARVEHGDDEDGVGLLLAVVTASSRSLQSARTSRTHTDGTTGDARSGHGSRRVHLVSIRELNDDGLIWFEQEMSPLLLLQCTQMRRLSRRRELQERLVAVG